jgi:hypothetical protein
LHHLLDALLLKGALIEFPRNLPTNAGGVKWFFFSSVEHQNRESYTKINPESWIIPPGLPAESGMLRFWWRGELSASYSE